MVSFSTWFRYIAHKFEYSLSLSYKGYAQGEIARTNLGDAVWKNMFQGRLTYLHWNKGKEMAPTIEEQGGTLLVRKLAMPDTRIISVGDVVDLKNPDNYLVRRLAATEGYEMASTDEKDEPFVLGEDGCWVLADNKELKPKEAKDSRLLLAEFYILPENCCRSWSYTEHVDGDALKDVSVRKDTPILEVELDVDEMAKNQKVYRALDTDASLALVCHGFSRKRRS